MGAYTRLVELLLAWAVAVFATGGGFISAC